MITKTNVDNREAFILENEFIACTVIPSVGAKISSVYDKRGKREWLVPTMRPIEKTGYQSTFTEQSMGGWDEMLPTIDRCKWKGIHLPDHGEVWQIPWSSEVTDTSIKTTVSCYHFPFVFSRNISLLSDNTFLLSYSLKNNGSEKFPWLWAAHPQFSANPYTKIVFPEEVKHMVNVIEGDPVLGPAGTVVEFPASSGDGTCSLDTVRPSSSRTCRKLYCPAECSIDHAGLIDSFSQCSLQLQWDKEIIPYCGLWVDEGAYHVDPVAAIEPTSAYYDSLKTAAKQRRLPFLDPQKTVCWKVYLSLSFFG